MTIDKNNVNEVYIACHIDYITSSSENIKHADIIVSASDLYNIKDIMNKANQEIENKDGVIKLILNNKKRG